MEIFKFILVSIMIIAIPGPNVLIIVSTTITQGRLRGLQTVVGTSAAMAIQLLISALCTAWFVTGLTQGLLWLKWAGVIYLLYLGINHLRDAISTDEVKPISAIGSFHRGFLISLTNPKTLLFFSAFLPQFVLPTEPYLLQIVQLSIVFLGLAILLDTGYALLANRLIALLDNRNLSKNQNSFSGLFYLGAGATLAATKNGQ